MRSPLDRHATSPALRFLREALLRDLAPDRAAAWHDRFAAGGLVLEIAAASDLRRCLPWVGRTLARAGLDGVPPPAERALLAAARLSAAERARRVALTLEPLGAACRAEGIAPLLLKGTALHGGLHPDAGLRPVSDVDLCVAPAELPALRRAFEGAGLVPEPLTEARLGELRASGGRAFVLSDFIFRRRDGAGVPVEAKLDPVQLGLPLRRPEAFFAGATPSPAYPGFRVPAPEPMAVQQALHLARHDGSDVLWWAELARGISAAAADGRFDARRAAALVDGEGLLGSVRAVFAAAEALFPGSVPAAARAGAGTAGVTPRRVRGRPRTPRPPDERAATWSLQAAHALSSGRPGAVLEALGRRVWPGAGYVRVRLGLPNGSRVGFAGRARRLLGLFGKDSA